VRRRDPGPAGHRGAATAVVWWPFCPFFLCWVLSGVLSYLMSTDAMPLALLCCFTLLLVGADARTGVPSASVSSVTPSQGFVGAHTAVTLTGANFCAGNVQSVQFGSVNAFSYTVHCGSRRDTWSYGTISTTSPAASMVGMVTVHVNVNPAPPRTSVEHTHEKRASTFEYILPSGTECASDPGKYIPLASGGAWQGQSNANFCLFV
jgi:hypothetical protein